MGAAQNYIGVSRRPPDIEDYIDMLRRYRSWIVGPMFAGLVISVVVAFIWPDTYVSHATMWITPQQVSERIVPSELNQQMMERIHQMTQEILSRTSIEEMIKRPSLNLYPREQATEALDDIAQEMVAKHIHIVQAENPGGENDRRYATAFAISFEYSDRFKAQSVVRELVTKFMEQNVNVEGQQARATSTFLDDELKRAKDHLDDMQQRMTRFQVENNGRLPEQFQANVSAEQVLQMDASRVSDQLNQARSQKLLLENQLQGLMNDERFLSSRSEDTLSPQQLSVKNESLINVDRQLTSLHSELASFQQLYGENYPEIGTLKASIGALEKQKADLERAQAEQAAAAATGPVKVTNPEVAQRLETIRNNISMSKARIQAEQVEIEHLTQTLADTTKRIAGFQSRIEESPLNEQQYVALSHEMDLAKAQYDEQVKKREQSQTAQNLMEHRAGEQLAVLDPASLPETPTEPNRPVWAGVGTVIGLLIGIVLAAAREMKDASLKNLKDVRAYTNLAVLSSVPLLENALLVRRKRRLFWLAWSSAFIVGSISMASAMYYHYFGRTS